MKRWTQGEVDRWCKGIDGCLRLPQGDYTSVNFNGANRVIIAPYSILGPGAELGEDCELGDHCEIGDYFVARHGLLIGAHCRFGVEAQIPEGTRVGRGCVFARDAIIAEKDVEIGDGVEFTGTCRRLFGVLNVDARRMIKICLADRRTMYGFADADGVVYIHIQDGTMELHDFLRAAHYIKGRDALHAAAKYIGTALALKGAG